MNSKEEKNKIIGKKLYNARKLKKLTMKEVGVLVNLHESTVNRYEAGTIKSISIDKLKEFAIALELEIDDLMGGVGKEQLEDLYQDSLTINLVKELLSENIIQDPDNIPTEITNMIISALKKDIKKSTK